jgi:hypothetical protein
MNIKIYIYTSNNDKNLNNLLKDYEVINLSEKKINLEFIKNIHILIVEKNNKDLFKITKKLNTIVFTNNNDYMDNSDYVYYKNYSELKKYLDILNNNLDKSFSIIIPVYNSYEYLDKCIDSVKKQTINNYKILICDDNSDIDTYLKYKTIYKNENEKNISIFRNSQNYGKFISINMVLHKINTDYFLILDSDDMLKKNRLLYDLINFNIDINNDILCVQSKYLRLDKKKKSILINGYGQTSVSFKKDIINKIGYFCPNRFGSDTEYIMRIKHFIGKEKIFKYDKLTYLSIMRKDNSNLTTIYNNEQRKKLIEKIYFIYKNLNNLNLFNNLNLDYFIDLIKFEKDTLSNINLEQYNKFYLDIQNFNNKQLLKHWNEIGINEERLPNLYTFYYYYPNFNWKLFMKNNKFLNNEYQVYGYVYLKNKNNYINILKKNNIINLNNLDLIDKKIINSNEVYNFESYIQQKKIKYIYVSKALAHFETRICDKFNLLKYNNLCDKFENVLFFGLYNNTDYIKITNHLGKKYLMWGGTDANTKYDFRNEILNKIKYYLDITNLSISNDIEQSLLKFNIPSIKIYLNLVDKKIFKPIEITGKSIYIYNGYTKGNEEIYGKDIYEEVIHKLSNYKFIKSNDLKVPYENMPKIYSKCFIGLRLTNHDGNANTVQEFNSMNIPIIFNGNGGIKWKNSDDIINTIKMYSDKNIILNNKDFTINEDISNYTKTYDDYIKDTSDSDNIIKHEDESSKKVNKNILQQIKKYDNVKEINFSDQFNIDDLDDINKNIDNFTKLFLSYKKILFICGDYPGYGGASTNCDKLQIFFDNNNFKTFVVYFNYHNEKNIKIETTEKYKIIEQINLQSELSNLNFQPDIIILKNSVNLNLKKIFTCPIIFLIPGIFLNNLDKFYFELKNKDEYDKYINQQTLLQIKMSDITFCNSSHTKEILFNIYGIKTYLFYSSFISYYKKNILIDNNYEKRKYDYGVIISNYDRKIKNIELIINYLKSKNNVILIGNESSKYSLETFTSLEYVDNNDLINYYREIKNIVNFSFYESCSNVMIESIFNGCSYINIKKMTSELISMLFKNTLTNIKKNTKKILIIDIYKNIERLNYLNKISQLLLDVEINVLIFIDKNYNTNNYYLNNNLILISIDKEEKFDISYLKNILKNNYERILIFDYKLPLILKNIILNDITLCFINDVNKDMIEQSIFSVLDHYDKKLINDKDLFIEINYNLVKINNNLFLKNKYMINNIDNDLLNTILVIN